jgi:hypothetical protein
MSGNSGWIHLLGRHAIEGAGFRSSAKQEISCSISVDRENIGRGKAQGDLPSEAWQHRSDHYRLAVMKTKKASALSQEAIDRRVVAQSENDSAWEAPIRVKRSKPASLSIPGELAARAAFLTRLHREADLESWVERVLRERVELEEFAFTEAKKNLTRRSHTRLPAGSR